MSVCSFKEKISALDFCWVISSLLYLYLACVYFICNILSENKVKLHFQ